MSRKIKTIPDLNVLNHITVLSVFALSLLVLIHFACSPKSGSGLLRFFFDGVVEKKISDSLLLKKAVENSQEIKPAVVDSQSTTLFVHPPYKERACLKCHNGEVPGTSSYNQETSCYSCHKNYTEKYEVVHGPVAAGFCTTCHAPHSADNKKLLRKQGQELCLDCHDPDLVFKNETHSEIGKKNCTECHNPHGGSDRSMQN